MRSLSVGHVLSVITTLFAGCVSNSTATIDGPSSAKVGEAVTITAEGQLVSDNTSDIGLMAYDPNQIVQIDFTKLVLDGGTELKGEETPASYDADLGITDSNARVVQHDQRVVTFSATAEVTCIAPGELVDDKNEALVGLEWWYNDSDSGGRLQTGDFTFSCEE